jgi:transcriptional regulator with GAF, ATPase, and Fis domain
MAGPDATRLLSLGARPTALAVRGFSVEVLAGPDQGKRVNATGRSLVIGTDAGADLSLTDPHVSRLHARIDAGEREHVLRDLGSTNGTRVGAVRIREACLDDGAVIDLGLTRLGFRLGSEALEIPLLADERFEGLIGRSPAMRELFGLLAKIAPTEATVLVEGETGVGKELVARALHARSRRHGRPFLVLDCGAVPPSLIESELFGHERGAFTGAVAARAGVFERAHGGTLFLDELGELALELQPKLLRVLETGELTRVGGERPIRVDVRVVAATHRDLPRMVGERRFREDLYYRVAVIRVRVPPLRERREDIPLLAAAFARQVGAGAALPDVALEAVFETYRRHDWPGNVRELRNAVERALVLADVDVDADGAGRAPAEADAAVAAPAAESGAEATVGPTVIAAEAEAEGDGGAAAPARRSPPDAPASAAAATLDGAQSLARSVDGALGQRPSLRAARHEHEREYLKALLRAVDGDVTEAARIAEVHPKSLERLVRKHRL